MEKQPRLHFIVEKADNHYEFVAPAGAPFGEVHDALYEILKEVLAMAQAAAQKVESQKEN